MNKKLNTFLFILGATVANLLIMIVLFLISLAIMVNFSNPESPLVPLYIGLIFIVSIGGSFFLYTLIMKKVMAKFNLEKYLSPLFAKKYSPKKEYKDK
jgi:ABC-type transport system involved in multi-copper enzyme maturation permease subunit